MKIWCFEDVHNWGSMLAKAASARGHDAHLFDDPRQPDNGFVFTHMHHHPQVRLLHKRCMAIMAMNPELTLIPEYRSSVLYDDKLEQARQLSKWMPRTRVFYTPGAARKWLASADLKLPFMSKAADGASSHNVRLISTLDEAKNEIRQSFSDLGIKCRYGQVQRGYLLWQDFIPENAGDIRIIAIGSKRLLLRRGNRADRPMASGSGNLKPITGRDFNADAELKSALSVADVFFNEENFKWCGIDMVYDRRISEWKILETTVGWTLHGYYECEFIDSSHGEPAPTGRMGTAIWDVLLDEMERGGFQNGS